MRAFEIGTKCMRCKEYFDYILKEQNEQLKEENTQLKAKIKKLEQER